jgi:UDP-N-acetylmuramoylalanine--D-glutamate ligase
LTFSIDDDSADSFYRDGVIYIIHEGSTIPAVKVKKLSILGIHNIQNVMAALLMVTSLHKKLKLEPDFEMIAAACYSFSGLEHRMELAGEYMGRTFVNDSKATTIGAVEMAVKSIRDKGVLIIGGRTKGDDYSRLRDIVGEKARCIVVIGESSDMFSEIFSGFNVVRALSMEDAVAKSMKNSEEGDMILLSPACASFDMFSSYDERGKAFKESFRKLIKGEISWI